MLTFSPLLRSSNIHTILYSMAFFKSEPQPEKERKPRQHDKTNTANIKFNQTKAEAIDSVNKYFEGIRVNTRYSKFYNEDQFTKINGASGKKIADLPFNPSTLAEPLQRTKISKVTQAIFNKLNQEQLISKLKEMSSGYFSDLIKKERTVKIEPNFERDARNTIASLTRDGNNYILGERKEEFELHMTNVELFRGIEVIRNNNYSIDSYEVNKEEGFTHYKLWERGVYKIPEPEWFHQQSMLIRITAKVETPYNIQHSKSTNTNTSKTGEKLYHTFVFEMDLRQPPRFSSFRYTPEEHLRLYEPVLNNLMITNVDQRNSFYAFTYEEYEKKDKLINKLV